MSDLVIGVEFLTGRCVAADVSNRDEPEWPPHPGRIFMALAAACFERDEDEAEVASLHWLESLPAPQIVASRHERRSAVKCYVPVNDKITASKALLQSTPGIARSKQERSYPTAIPYDPVVKYVWKNVPGIADTLDALAKVCANVIRVGHSSSVVRCWVETIDGSDALGHARDHIVWQPVTKNSEFRVRIVGEGELARLRTACNAETINRFSELASVIESSKGTLQKEAKRVFEATFGTPFKSSLRPPEPTPPILGLWQGYRQEGVGEPREVTDGAYFSSELLILAKLDGPTIGIQDSLALTSRLREAAMSRCPDEPTPAWLGGHDADGTPAQQPHAAFIPLPFVGVDHADGHIMGLALALPRTVSLQERGRLLGPLLLGDDGEPCDVDLKLGNLGVWTLRLEERVIPPRSLQNRSWTGPSTTWASATPVVLDRFPKSSRVEDRLAWEEEVRATVAQSCVRGGLPLPADIDIDTTSWHLGAPRAYAKTRLLRGRTARGESTRLGDGFPPMPARTGKPSRPQIHVYLRFDRLVRGPVLLGAGRFLGYGLCKPITQARKS